MRGICSADFIIYFPIAFVFTWKYDVYVTQLLDKVIENKYFGVTYVTICIMVAC